MDSYLNNLAAIAMAEKNVLDKLVKSNEQLIDQLAKLTKNSKVSHPLTITKQAKNQNIKGKIFFLCSMRQIATAIHMDTNAPRDTKVRPALDLDHLTIVWQLIKIPKEAVLRKRIGCVVNMKKRVLGDLIQQLTH